MWRLVDRVCMFDLPEMWFGLLCFLILCCVCDWCSALDCWVCYFSGFGFVRCIVYPLGFAGLDFVSYNFVCVLGFCCLYVLVYVGVWV